MNTTAMSFSHYVLFLWWSARTATNTRAYELLVEGQVRAVGLYYVLLGVRRVVMESENKNTVKCVWLLVFRVGLFSAFVCIPGTVPTHRTAAAAALLLLFCSTAV